MHPLESKRFARKRCHRALTTHSSYMRKISVNRCFISLCRRRREMRNASSSATNRLFASIFKGASPPIQLHLTWSYDAPATPPGPVRTRKLLPRGSEIPVSSRNLRQLLGLTRRRLFGSVPSWSGLPWRDGRSHTLRGRLLLSRRSRDM